MIYSKLVWDQFKTSPGPLWDQSGTTMGPVRDYYGTSLGPLKDQSGTIIGPLLDQSSKIKTLVVTEHHMAQTKLTVKNLAHSNLF